jgi:hypothetical protein
LLFLLHASFFVATGDEGIEFIELLAIHGAG